MSVDHQQILADGARFDFLRRRFAGAIDRRIKPCWVQVVHGTITIFKMTEEKVTSSSTSTGSAHHRANSSPVSPSTPRSTDAFEVKEHTANSSSSLLSRFRFGSRKEGKPSVSDDAWKGIPSLCPVCLWRQISWECLLFLDTYIPTHEFQRSLHNPF